MALLVSIYLGLKGLAILVSTVISGGEEGKVSLQIRSMEFERDSVYINVQVDSIYSPELDEFCESGTSIPLRLETSLLSEKGLVIHRVTTNFLKYDLTANRYRLISPPDTVFTSDKKEAKERFPLFSIPLFANSRDFSAKENPASIGRGVVWWWPAPGLAIELIHTIFIFSASCFHN